MIVFRVTQMEAYRRFLLDEEMEVANLVRYLRGETPPSRAMQAGTALHKILETSDACDLDAAEQDGFRFLFDIDAVIPLPQVRELKAQMEFSTPVGSVTLTGTVDGLTGHTVRDYKLTSRFDAQMYADSYQWRAYLSMFGASRFDYEVFVGKDEGDAICIYDYHPLTFYRYPHMVEDVKSMVSDFAEFWAKNMHMKEAA